MVEHVCSVLREVVDELVVVGSDALELPPLDARRVTDREPGLGPLAGIREGLEAISAPRAFVTATDAPYLTPALVSALLERGDAVAPVVDGHVQTLSAVYPRALAKTAGALIEAGRLRPLFLLEAAEFVRVAAEELPDPDAVRGFNTPEEYLEAVRADDPRARVTVECLASGSGGGSSVQVPVGTLSEVLANAGLQPSHGSGEGGRSAYSLEGCFVPNGPGVPLGAGERLVVTPGPAEAGG